MWLLTLAFWHCSQVLAHSQIYEFIRSQTYPSVSSLMEAYLCISSEYWLAFGKNEIGFKDPETFFYSKTIPTLTALASTEKHNSTSGRTWDNSVVLVKAALILLNADSTSPDTTISHFLMFLNRLVRGWSVTLCRWSAKQMISLSVLARNQRPESAISTWPEVGKGTRVGVEQGNSEKAVGEGWREWPVDTGQQKWAVGMK